MEECDTCLGNTGEAGALILLIVGLVTLCFFTIIGIFYSISNGTRRHSGPCLFTEFYHKG